MSNWSPSFSFLVYLLSLCSRLIFRYIKSRPPLLPRRFTILSPSLPAWCLSLLFHSGHVLSPFFIRVVVPRYILRLASSCCGRSSELKAMTSLWFYLLIWQSIISNTIKSGSPASLDDFVEKCSVNSTWSTQSRFVLVRAYIIIYPCVVCYLTLLFRISLVSTAPHQFNHQSSYLRSTLLPPPFKSHRPHFLCNSDIEFRGLKIY